MKRCWHPDLSQRPTINEVYHIANLFENHYCCNRYCDNIWAEFNKAEKNRLEMINSKKPTVKNSGYEHPNSRYFSTLLNPTLESIRSTTSGIDFKLK